MNANSGALSTHVPSSEALFEAESLESVAGTEHYDPIAAERLFLLVHEIHRQRRHFRHVVVKQAFSKRYRVRAPQEQFEAIGKGAALRICHEKAKRPCTAHGEIEICGVVTDCGINIFASPIWVNLTNDRVESRTDEIPHIVKVLRLNQIEPDGRWSRVNLHALDKSRRCFEERK